MSRWKFSFKKVFGSKGSSSGISGEKASTNNASNKHTLDRLREMEELLQKKQLHLETKIKEQLADALKFGKKNKRAALMALKRKKRLTEELTRIDGTLTTIELQREALEAARNNVQVLGAMQDAAKVLKNAQKFVTVDKVLDVMDEVNEQQDISREIAEAISNPLGRMSTTIDDSELEKELEMLEQEELDKALLHVDEVEPTDRQVASSPIYEVDSHHDDPIASTTSGGTTATSLNEQNENKKATAQGKNIVLDPDEEELRELAQWSI